jgi:predicted DNA-binding transcriptional regulator AlpA
MDWRLLETNMTTRKKPLKQSEIQAAFSNENNKFPEIISPEQLGQLLGIAVKTIYEWIAKGRFDGAFRKRGKGIRFWRDRAIEIYFNGPDWNNDGKP